MTLETGGSPTLCPSVFPLSVPRSSVPCSFLCLSPRTISLPRASLQKHCVKFWGPQMPSYRKKVGCLRNPFLGRALGQRGSSGCRWRGRALGKGGSEEQKKGGEVQSLGPPELQDPPLLWLGVGVPARPTPLVLSLSQSLSWNIQFSPAPAGLDAGGCGPHFGKHWIWGWGPEKEQERKTKPAWTQIPGSGIFALSSTPGRGFLSLPLIYGRGNHGSDG